MLAYQRVYDFPAVSLHWVKIAIATWILDCQKPYSATVIPLLFLWNYKKNISTRTGWWMLLSHPSEKYERQLGWWNSKYFGKIIQSCSSHHQPEKDLTVVSFLLKMERYIPEPTRTMLSGTSRDLTVKWPGRSSPQHGSQYRKGYPSWRPRRCVMRPPWRPLHHGERKTRKVSSCFYQDRMI